MHMHFSETLNLGVSLLYLIDNSILLFCQYQHTTAHVLVVMLWGLNRAERHLVLRYPPFNVCSSQATIHGNWGEEGSLNWLPPFDSNWVALNHQ